MTKTRTRTRAKGAAGDLDVCQLFVAELEWRRERLRHLLSLVQKEVARQNSGGARRKRTHSATPSVRPA